MANFDGYSKIGIGEENKNAKDKGSPTYMELMELLLFDLIRKAYSCKNPRYLIRVLSWIN